MKWKDERPIRKNNTVLREIEGESLLVPIAQFDDPFLILYTLNDAGRFIWDIIGTSCSAGEIVKKLMEQYEVDEKCAQKDVEMFLSLLHDKDLISFNKVENDRNM